MKLLERAVERSLQLGIAEAEDIEIYRFALANLPFEVATWGLFLFVGGLLGQFGGCLLFLLAYLPLRANAGGFHNASRGRCFITSLVIFAFVLVGRHVPFIFWQRIGVACLLCACLIVWLLAPMADANKPLSQVEIKRYKKRARAIVASLAGLGIGALLIHLLAGYYIIAAVMTAAVLLVAGKVALSRNRKW